jgi:hypothetical protein
LRKERISKNAKMMQEGKEELERVGPSPFDIVAAQTPSSPKAP